MDFGYIFLILFAIVAFFILSIVLGSFFTVETSQVAIVQRLGKFARCRSRPQLEDAISRDGRAPPQYEGPAIRRSGRDENAG